MTLADVLEAWDKADPAAIHPSRADSEDAYWASGQAQAEQLATVLPDGCRVVDLGCGDGRVARPLAALGYQVTAADASPRMLNRLNQHEPDMPTVLSNGIDLYEQLGKKVDAIVCLAVLIHHTYADCLDIVTGLRAATKANGILVLDWPTSDQPVEANGWLEVSTWDPAEQDKACKRLGLKRLDSDLPWGVYRAVKAT